MWDHLDFHIYYQKSFSGRPPLLSSPHPRSENMVKAYFLVKKRQSHPKVTLSQKHVVSSNQKEDNPLSLIKILRNYTSTIPYFLIMSTPFTGPNFSTFSKMLFGCVFMGQKIKCAIIAHFISSNRPPLLMCLSTITATITIIQHPFPTIVTER